MSSIDYVSSIRANIGVSDALLNRSYLSLISLLPRTIERYEHAFCVYDLIALRYIDTVDRSLLQMHNESVHRDSWNVADGGPR